MSTFCLSPSDVGSCDLEDQMGQKMWRQREEPKFAHPRLCSARVVIWLMGHKHGRGCTSIAL